MEIPIFNSLYWGTHKSLKTKSLNLTKFNSLNFTYAKTINFPLLNLIKSIPNKDSLFETVIVSANDYLVKLFLNKKIKFTDIIKVLLKITHMKNFIKFKKKSPRSVTEIVKIKDFTIKLINELYPN